MVANVTVNIIGYAFLQQHNLILLHKPARLFPSDAWEHDKGTPHFLTPVPDVLYANPFIRLIQELYELPYHYPLVGATAYYTRDEV